MEDFKPIPFDSGQASGLEELGGAAPLRINVLTDSTGYFRPWPGTSTWDYFDVRQRNGSTVTGITEWLGNLVWVTEDRRWYALTASGFGSPLSDGTLATQIQGDRRPIFARTKSRLFVAGGGQPQYWTGSGLSARVTGAPAMTHIAAIATRLASNMMDGSGYIRYTDTFEASHLTWPALNFFEAEARPDDVVAVHENSNELFAFGTESLQVYVPDANVYFAPQSTLNIGCSAPYSIIPLYESGAFALLDHDRELVVTSGRGDASYIGSPEVSKTIKELSTISDCWAFRANLPPYDVLVWVFPTDGRAFAYDFTGKKWCELRGHSGMEWIVWPVTAYYYWRDKNVHLVGLETGEIQMLDFSSMTQAGLQLRAEITAGFIDHGTKRKKQTIRLRVPMRRGEASFGSTEQFVELSYRDGTGAYGDPIRLGMGTAGDSKPFVERRVISRPYVSRQWKLTMNCAIPPVVGNPEEKVELLDE